MIGLLRVEVLRALWRRAVLVLLAAAVLLPLALALGVGITTHKPAPEEYAQAEKDYQQEVKRSEREVKRCLKHPDRYDIPAEADVEELCHEYFQIGPKEDWIYFDTLSLDDEREEGSGLGVAAILAALMFLLGTTFAGHDWNTGSMVNQVLVEPRRWRVWGAKAIAVTVAALVAAVVGATVFWLATNAMISIRDFPEPRAGALTDALQQGWRSAGFAAGAALFGYLLTMLTRSTVFTIGAVFAVSVAGGILLGALGPNDSGWLNPGTNAAAVIQDGVEYYVQVPDSCWDGMGYEARDTPECDDTRERTLGDGVSYWLILTGLVGAASGASFRRRDVS